MRDEYTGNHTQRVTTYALTLAEEWACRKWTGDGYGWRRCCTTSAKSRSTTRMPAEARSALGNRIRHDEVARHSAATEIIQMIPGLGVGAAGGSRAPRRWDGRGYPDRLAGEDIPLWRGWRRSPTPSTR